MIKETLDESIDRVAARLTMIRPNPEFAERLEARLERASFRVPLWVVAASMAAAVLIVVAVLRFDRFPIPGERQPTIATTATQQPQATSANTLEGVHPSTEPVEVAAGPMRPAPAAEPVPSIAALTVPQTLRVEELTLSPLTIDPVTDLGILDLGALELRNIDATIESKEY